MRKVNLLVHIAICTFTIGLSQSSQACENWLANICNCDTEEPSQQTTTSRENEPLISGSSRKPTAQAMGGEGTYSACGSITNTHANLHAPNPLPSSATRQTVLIQPLNLSRPSALSLSTWQRGIIKANLRDRVSDGVWENYLQEDYLDGEEYFRKMVPALIDTINALDPSLFKEETDIIDVPVWTDSFFQLSIGGRILPTVYNY